jgi:ribose transport system substrate-binding protein
VAERTGLSTATAFRILFTLEQRGLVTRIADKQYRINIRLPGRRRHRIGFAGQSQQFSFSRTVAESVAKAAAKADIDLVMLDNQYSAKVAVRNAETFVRERVELVIEFQTDEQAANIISAHLLEAQIPLIAVEIPHPGATFYGANNYNAGVMGGHFLGRWAKQQWRGEADEILLIELPIAGALPRSRLMGTLAGIRDILPHIDECRVAWVDGHGLLDQTAEAVGKHIRLSRARNFLVGAINDPSALGAVQAFEAAGRPGDCAVLGQNATLEARNEMRKPGSRLVASVAYFPERYGEGLIALAVDLLRGKPVPPAIFVKHQIVSRDNVDRLFPNDLLTSLHEPFAISAAAHPDAD